MDKWNVIYENIYMDINGILLSHKEEWSTDAGFTIWVNSKNIVLSESEIQVIMKDDFLY